MTQHLRILIAEDNPNDTELVLRELRRAGFTPDWHRVETEQAYLDGLHPDVDLILSDYHMPAFTGMRALEILKEKGMAIPFIIISGTIGEDIAVEVMKKGATDYLLKDRLARLGAAASQALKQSRLRRERKKIEADLQRAQEQFQRLLEHSPAVIYSLKVEGLAVLPQFISENIHRLLGYSMEEAATFEWWVGCLHPDDKVRALACISQTFDRGVMSCDYRMRHRKGTYIWVEDNQRLVCDAGGHPVEIAGVWTEITERKRVEEAMQRQQTELRVLFDLVPAMIWFKDTENNFLRVNQRVLEATGRQAHEIEGKSASEVFPEEAAQYYTDDLEVIRAKVPKLGIVEKLQGPEGQDLWVQTDKVPYCDEDGNVIGIVAMVQDVTERKQAEDVAKRSQKRLRDIMDGFGPSVFVGLLTPEGILIEVNQAPLAAAGLMPEDVLGKPFAETHWWTSSLEAQQQLRAAITRAAGGESSRYDVRTRGVGNEFIDIDFSLHPLRDETGKVVFLVPSAIVITERKRAEMEVRLNEQRFRSLVEATTAIVWDTAPSGEFETEQPGWTAFTGQRFDELRGWGWLTCIHPDDQAETARVWSAAIASGSIYQVEHRLKASDQTYRDMAVRAVPILAEDGTIQQWIGIHTDITERKKLEQQFLRAQRMESLGTLAGGIAHDLNNVLSPIMMAVDLLKMQEQDAARLSILGTVENSAQRGADMVRQVLTFARGAEGHRLSVNIGQLLGEVERIANDTFLKNIEVRSDIPEGLWTVRGDSTQLHQVLLNLCVNARDAMPAGGLLTVSGSNLLVDKHYACMYAEVQEGSYVVIEVEDSGTGMAPDVIERIFEPFFTTKEVGKGTGLGLSTTQAIIKSHGGFIRVYSEMGKGTKFRVGLPAESSGAALPDELELTELPRGNGELVLVVDDETAVRDITRQTLEAFGYRVLVASEGAAAVAMYDAQKIEIAAVLTDMMMPGMDGPSTIKELVRINPQVRIIAASGLNAKGMISEASSAGARHFIPKPYTAETLLKVLKKLLSDAR